MKEVILERAPASRETVQAAIDRLKQEQTIVAYTALANILVSAVAPDLATIRLGVIRNFTVEPLIPIIKGEFARAGFLTDLHLGEFDTAAADTLNPQSALYAHKPDVILFANWLETLSPRLTVGFMALSNEDVQGEIGRVISHLEELVNAIRKKSSAPILINNFPLIDYPTLGILDAQSESSHTASILLLNAELLKVLKKIPDVYIVDYFSVFSRIGTNQAFDDRHWQIARAPLKRDALISLGVEYGKFLRALKGKSRKCLVLDCDNTLWGGVIGEDGIDGIKVGVTHPGSGFSAFQTEILNLYHRGVLLALCSKNNEVDVMEVFEKHPDMVLKTHHFSSWQVNWDDKATNLSRLASVLNIGLDSFVFADDNAFECEWVQKQLPQVATLHLQGDSSSFKKQLCEQGFFDALVFTEEDRKRTAMYLSAVKNEELKNDSGSYEGYLQNLGLQAEIGVPDITLIPRVSQLTQKTNQFNLTTLRYSEGDIQRIVESTDSDVYYVKLKDKFTDLGLIGVAIVNIRGEDTYIDTLALSCRALGRGVENALLTFVLQQAKCRGSNRVVGRYVPTAKNAQVADFFEKQGFCKLAGDASGSDWEWRFSEKDNLTYPEYIELMSNTEKNRKNE